MAVKFQIRCGTASSTIVVTTTEDYERIRHYVNPTPASLHRLGNFSYHKTFEDAQGRKRDLATRVILGTHMVTVFIDAVS
jgi:hypothetical protein